MPKYELYWDSMPRYEPIVPAMPLERYKKLWQFLHVNDKKNDSGKRDDRLYTVTHVVERGWQNCSKVERGEFHSIDGQIIPAKARYGTIWQHNPNSHWS